MDDEANFHGRGRIVFVLWWEAPGRRVGAEVVPALAVLLLVIKW
jgi:hypothetical protein